MPDNSKPPIPPPDVSVVKVIEGHKTARLIAICVTFLGSLITAAIAYCTVMRPSWEVVLLALLGPTGLAITAIKVYWRYVRKNHNRTVALEKQLDANRTSSRQLPPVITSVGKELPTEFAPPPTTVSESQGEKVNGEPT